MNLSVDVGEDRLPGGLPVQAEPRLMDSRPMSSSSSDNENEDYAEALWDELDAALQAQEDDFFAQDEPTLQGMPGPLFDTPATPPRPLSPMGPIIPGQKGEYQPHISPPRPHVLLHPQGASVAGQSATTSPARESPSLRFFASPDQIDDLGMPTTWLHGQVISTLGDTFCYTSRSKPRNEKYDILPTNLFDLWKSYVGGHIASRTCLSRHFKEAASPFECRAWLVPVLLKQHWYLLAFDWIDSALHIYDSLARSKNPHPSLVEFGGALLHLITEDFAMEDCDWNVVSEQASGFHRRLTKF